MLLLLAAFGSASGLPPALAAMLGVLAGGLLCAASTADAAPDYAERYRPQFHYTPPRNWMNDPNGLVHHDGTYHLFYQYNPEGSDWGNLSWGHATSPDLVHWTPQPLALPATDEEMIFSGSAVTDRPRTTGFGNEDQCPLVAVYTSHYPRPDGTTNQAQSLAYSLDGGTTWTKYAGNPVLDHPAPDFRDPNVFWYAPDEVWVMAVALATRHVVQFYASPDLVHWTHLSDFGPAGDTRGVWECPALLRVPVEGTARTRWVLKVDLNPGEVSGGQYFVGTFDGDRFVPDDGPAGAARWVDHGRDFYAAIPWNDAPDDEPGPRWIGWMGNWTYAGETPTAPWRGAQSLPRTLRLRPVDGELRLVQAPAAPLEQLREAPVRVGDRALRDETVSLVGEGISGTTLELDATFEVGDARTLGLHVREGTRERTVVGYDAAAGSVFVDRTRAGTAPADAFGVRDDAPLSPSDGRIRLRVFVDASSVEVFAEEGLRTLTHTLFPAPSSDGVSAFAAGGTARLVELDAWPLRSIWTQR